MTYSRKKIPIDKEWLAEQYTTLCRPIRDIAKDLGCSVATVDKWLRRWEIRREKGKRCFVSWNTGLTKETDPRLRKISEDRKGARNPMHGKPAWNKGLTADTNETVARMTNAQIGRKASDETRQKQRLAKLGLRGDQANHWKGGKSHLNAAGYEVNYRGYRHRQIVEELIGRKLERLEHVHHLDGNKNNNELKNLLLLTVKAHRRLHTWMKGKTRSAATQKLWLLQNNMTYESFDENHKR